MVLHILKVQLFCLVVVLALELRYFYGARLLLGHSLGLFEADCIESIHSSKLARL